MTPFSTANYCFYWSLLKNKTYKQRLTFEERNRYSRKIPRCALRRYHDSPFRFLFNSGNDQALLNITGVDQRVFRQLLAIFQPSYVKYTIDPSNMQIRSLILDRNGNPRGKPRELDAVGALGLVLMWYRSRGACTRSLSAAFGSTSTPLYVWLHF